MVRRFSKKDMSAERDADGHRTGFKIYLKLRRRMQPESFLRWGHKSRAAISKHKTVWVYYGSSRAIGLPNGIPIEAVKTNKALGEYLITRFFLADNETYALHSWCEGRTKTHVKLTKALCHITVHNADALKFTISNDGRLSRYWMRRQKKRREVTFG